MKRHCQCVLERISGNSRSVLISWIPEKYAVVDQFLEIKNNGFWEDGWRVHRVDTCLPSKEVGVRSRDHLRQRKFSDI